MITILSFTLLYVRLYFLPLCFVSVSPSVSVPVSPSVSVPVSTSIYQSLAIHPSLIFVSWLKSVWECHGTKDGLFACSSPNYGTFFYILFSFSLFLFLSLSLINWMKWQYYTIYSPKKSFVILILGTTFLEGDSCRQSIQPWLATYYYLIRNWKRRRIVQSSSFYLDPKKGMKCLRKSQKWAWIKWVGWMLWKLINMYTTYNHIFRNANLS